MTPLPGKPFWETKTLAQMTRAEWESLCDGCGRCCLHKLEDEETGDIAQTNVACRLLNLESCRCTRYPERQRLVPDCVVLTLENVDALPWMPESCAYRRIVEGRGLAWWHPLVSGTAETVIEAGVSVKGLVISEREAGDLEDHIVSWLTLPEGHDGPS